MIHVFCDGGCLGNGGSNPICYGSYKIGNEKQVKLTFPKCHTNNEAEYQIIIQLLKDLPKTDEYIIHQDSNLVISQLTKGWKVNAPNLKPFHREASDLLRSRSNVKLEWVSERIMKEILGH